MDTKTHRIIARIATELGLPFDDADELRTIGAMYFRGQPLGVRDDVELPAELVGERVVSGGACYKLTPAGVGMAHRMRTYEIAARFAWDDYDAFIAWYARCRDWLAA